LQGLHGLRHGVPAACDPCGARERAVGVTRRLLTGNAAAAWGARLAEVDYVPAFPITPQTEIIETLSDWFERGEAAGRLVMLESEHSMLTAAAAAAATGVRVFTATSSQGLLFAMEMIYAVPGWRAPFVLANVSRALATPITLEPDHSDVLAARDSGFLQIHCATCQEVLDSVLIAYRLAEHPRVRLPAIVNLDGFYLSFTREPVEIPEAAAAREFLPAFDPGKVEFRASKPVSQAVAVLGGAAYSYFRYETHLAARAALGAYEEIAGEFARCFGRRHRAVESYRAEDAEIAFVMIGAFSTKALEAVDRLRALGVAAGLVRPRLLRPFPEDALRAALLGRRAIAVIDQNLSMGKGGVLAAEIASALYGRAGAPLIASYIGGLGGRDISPAEFQAIADETRAAAAAGAAPEPRLLYTASELRDVRKLQAIALAERREVGVPR
jgi:pyruvate ferredoxin oxidoreductase alpha subunit